MAAGQRRRSEWSLRRSERRESGADFFGKNRAAIPNGQTLANEVNKGVTVMTDWTNELEALQNEDKILQEKLRLARTMQPCQELLELEREVSADKEKLKNLSATGYQIAVKNAPEIQRLYAEIARLKSESIDLDADAAVLQLQVRNKQQQLFQLRASIEDDKNSV